MAVVRSQHLFIAHDSCFSLNLFKIRLKLCSRSDVWLFLHRTFQHFNKTSQLFFFNFVCFFSFSRHYYNIVIFFVFYTHSRSQLGCGLIGFLHISSPSPRCGGHCDHLPQHGLWRTHLGVALHLTIASTSETMHNTIRINHKCSYIGILYSNRM